MVSLVCVRETNILNFRLERDRVVRHETAASLCPGASSMLYIFSRHGRTVCSYFELGGVLNKTMTGLTGNSELFPSVFCCAHGRNSVMQCFKIHVQVHAECIFSIFLTESPPPSPPPPPPPPKKNEAKKWNKYQQTTENRNETEAKKLGSLLVFKYTHAFIQDRFS